LAAGIPLLAAFLLGNSGVLSRVQQASLIRVMIALLLPVQLLSLGYMMDRWQSGAGPGHALDPLVGTWQPVTGPALPLLMMVLGLAALAWLTLRRVRPADEQAAAVAPSPVTLAA
jgi:hypothetical protein